MTVFGLELFLDARELRFQHAGIFLEVVDVHDIEILGLRFLLLGIEIIEIEGHGAAPWKQLRETYHCFPRFERPTMSALPATMTCVEIKSPGGPEALVPTTRPVPQPKAGEILIKVAAAGVNEVCALTPGGSYAEYCTVPVPQCLPLAKGFDMLRAAALPENYFTVWHNPFERGGLKVGESVLIHGGASGIGTTAIQLAKAFGATVLTTVRNED